MYTTHFGKYNNPASISHAWLFVFLRQILDEFEAKILNLNFNIDI